MIILNVTYIHLTSYRILASEPLVVVMLICKVHLLCRDVQLQTSWKPSNNANQDWHSLYPSLDSAVTDGIMFLIIVHDTHVFVSLQIIG